MDDRDRWMSCFTDQELLDELVRRGVLKREKGIISTNKNPVHIQTTCKDLHEGHEPGEIRLSCCTIITPPTHISYSGAIPIGEGEGT